MPFCGISICRGRGRSFFVTGQPLRMTVKVRNAVVRACFPAAAGSPVLRAAKAEVSLPPGFLALRASVTRGYVCPALRVFPLWRQKSPGASGFAIGLAVFSTKRCPYTWSGHFAQYHVWPINDNERSPDATGASGGLEQTR